MSVSIADDEWDQSLALARVIERYPKLFQKWVNIKEDFSILDWMDVLPKGKQYYVSDVLRDINEAFQ